MERMPSDFQGDEAFMEDKNDIDIVIVGAGLSGLSCAYNILKSRIGLDVLIIEASDKVGGRSLSQKYNESFYAHFSQRYVTDLLRALNIETYRRWEIAVKKRILFTKKGALEIFPTYQSPELYTFLQTMQANSLDPRLSHKPDEEIQKLAEMSAEELLCRIVYFSTARSLCRAFICTICATRNLADVSALWLLILLNGSGGLFNRLRFAIGDNNRYFVQGGVTQIIHQLLRWILQENAEIKYKEPVQEIHFNDDRVYVLTELKCYKCSHVVVAVPPPDHNRIIIKSPIKLPKSGILYTPCENVFFNIFYKNPFWRENYTGDILTTWERNTNLNQVYDATKANGTKEFVLAGYLNKPIRTESLKREFFNTINLCFKTTNAGEYLKYIECSRIKDDQELRFSEGFTESGYPMSVMKPSHISNFVENLSDSYDRIWFASSEYATNWPGTIDGAIEAGEVAAYSILSKIRPQALTSHHLIREQTMKRKRKQSERSTLGITGIQYLGLALNIAIFLSFLKVAYDFK